MKIWWNSLIDEQRQLTEVSGGRIRLGRGAQNDVVLNSPYVAEEAAVLYKRSDGWELVALGLNGVQVGARKLYEGERIHLETDEEIKLYPFTVKLDLPRPEEVSREADRQSLDTEMSVFIGELHVELLRRLGPEAEYGRQIKVSDQQLLSMEQAIDGIAKDRGFGRGRFAPLVTHTAGHCVRSMLLNDVGGSANLNVASELLVGHEWSRMVSVAPERESELQRTQLYIAKQLKLDELDDASDQVRTIDDSFWDVWDKIADNIHIDFKTYMGLRFVKKQVKDIFFGYGPIEDLLRLPTVSEIMVVSRDHIYIENQGMLENSGRRFLSDDVTLAIIERIVSRLGRRIDKAQPLVDARLSDGSRVNAVIPPIAVSGPCLTIRKFSNRKLLIEDLIAWGALTRTAAEFLRAAVLCRKNLLISGGTGTGKTTLLNCLSDFIPDHERVVTIEDTAELRLNNEHVVSLETKQANIEGAGEYTIRDLVRNALRMRPDRIVVGECRGPEALDMLQAMNTGHDGSLTTIHANSAEDTVLRLEVLVQMAADLPLDSIHRQIASAVDVVVQLHRLRDGRRAVTQIAEVVGVDVTTSRIKTRNLFYMDHEDADDKELAATGHLPTFMEDLLDGGFLDLATFYQS